MTPDERELVEQAIQQAYSLGFRDSRYWPWRREPQTSVIWRGNRPNLSIRWRKVL